MAELFQIKEAIRNRKPSPEFLQRYIKRFTNRLIPGKAVCEGHQAPMDFLYELIYGEDDILVLTNRTGGKTANTGMGIALLAYHWGVPAKVLGGSEAQGERLYEEAKWFLGQGFSNRLASDLFKSGVRFTNGAWISIMTQSTKSTRGPHPPLCVYDEVDEFDEEVHTAGKSIPKTSSTIDFPAKLVQVSTRHYSNGLMSKEWDNAPEAGVKRFQWCVWEVMQACNENHGYKCSNCPLQAGGCPGKAKMRDSEGYIIFSDVLKTYKRLDEDSWNSEWRCILPRKSGSVYPTINREKLCGSRLKYNPNLPLWRSCDFGVDNETAIIYWQMDGIGRANGLQELRWSGVAGSTIASEMIAWENARGWHNFSGTIVDPAALSFKKELEKVGRSYPKERGLRTTLSADNRVDLGIAEMRNALVIQTDGLPRFVLDPVTCAVTVRELCNYKLRNGKPVKENDHGCDATRYLIMTCPDYPRSFASRGLRVLDQIKTG